MAQLTIVIGGFNLPNSIINSATWYATLLDFGRISLLFGFPIADLTIVPKLLAIGKRNKKHLEQFIDPKDLFKYDAINPVHFINLTPKQIDSIELAFNNSRDDLTFDPSFPFQSLQRSLHGTTKNV
jgi:hypothetical protein